MPKYEVRTIEWLRYEYSERPHQTRAPMSEVVHCYDRYAVARLTCDECNAKAWADPAFNPFHYGGETLFFQSTFPPGPFCDYLEDAGLDVSGVGESATNGDWAAWYELLRPGFTYAQLAAVQEAMNLVRFAEVVEVPDAVAKGYVVQELNWSWNDQSALDADPEGGNFVAVYRDRAKAEARCAELNAARQSQDEHIGYTEFNTDGRAGATPPHWRPIGETLFFEVVEVDLEASEGSP